MSTPVREPAGPLSYAPRWARSPGGIRAGAKADSAASRELTPTPDLAPARNSPPDPPWKRKKPAATFEGDIAIKELRARLALAPDQIPEPLPRQPGGQMFAVVARLAGVMVLTAAGALGFLWITAPRAAPPEVQTTGQAANQMDGQSGRQA